MVDRDSRLRPAGLGAHGWPKGAARSRPARVVIGIDAGGAGEPGWVAALAGRDCVAVRNACVAHQEVAVPRLMGALLCEVPFARANAAHLLGELAYPMATPALKRLAQSDPDEWVRCQALWALDTLLPAP